jgi:hypothetical protein
LFWIETFRVLDWRTIYRRGSRIVDKRRRSNGNWRNQVSLICETNVLLLYQLNLSKFKWETTYNIVIFFQFFIYFNCSSHFIIILHWRNLYSPFLDIDWRFSTWIIVPLGSVGHWSPVATSLFGSLSVSVSMRFPIQIPISLTSVCITLYCFPLRPFNYL